MSLPSNIILVGFMGSGKTSTGKELAQLLGYRFWDMDQSIEEKNNMKISKLFEEHGEEFFRSQEKEAVDWLKSKDHCVVSTGGGSWINEENRRKFLELGWCVWLKVSADKAMKRVGASLPQRPILARSKDPFKTIEEILAERNPFYSKAHSSFDTDEKKPREVALEIIHVLEEEHPFDLFPLQK